MSRHAKSDDGIGKWKAQGVTTENVVFACNDFVVFIDDALEVDWITSDSYDRQMDAIQKDPRWAELNSAITESQSIGVKQLGRGRCKALRRQLGTAMQLGLGGNLEGAVKAITVARAFLQKIQSEISRSRVIVSSAVSAGLVTMIAGAIAWFGKMPSWTELAVCSASGAWGSWLSISLRIDRLQLDPSDSLCMHVLEAARRIGVGAVAGPFLLIGAKVGLVLSFARNGGASAAALMGLIAGFSERRLPAMIGKLGSVGEPQR